MNKIAYLIMLVRVDGKRPRYAGLGVYSEPTPTFEGLTFVVAKANGNDFGDAKDRLYRQLAIPAYRWALLELRRDKWSRAEADAALRLLDERGGV